MRKQDKFLSALAASLALHLLLLWPAVQRERTDAAGQPLSVVLQAVAGEPHEASPSAAAPPRPLRRAADAAHASPMLAPQPAPQVPVAAASPSPGATPALTADAPSRSGGAPSPAGPARAVAAGAASGSPAPDPDGVRQYRMALAVEARRFRRYPERALAEDVSGTVEVRVAVGAGGQPQEVALARSSGSGALDEAALEMMRRAAPRAAVPEPLRRRAFAVDLPVVFDVSSE